jgi:histidine triad (HIT) family protein
MTQSCLFCRIVAREIDADVVFEDEDVLAFRDVAPQAPVHVLIIPKKHVPTVDDLRSDDAGLVSSLLLTAPRIARDQGVDRDGYRLVLNCREGAGQSVFHVHMHLLGGRRMNWPPG